MLNNQQKFWYKMEYNITTTFITCWPAIKAIKENLKVMHILMESVIDLQAIFGYNKASNDGFLDFHASYQFPVIPC